MNSNIIRIYIVVMKEYEYKIKNNCLKDKRYSFRSFFILFHNTNVILSSKIYLKTIYFHKNSINDIVREICNK
jgi:hypothetical protein